MILLPKVKTYFEEHISALDRDDWFEFVVNAYQDLNSEEFNQALEVLKQISANDFDIKIEPSMRYIITRAFEEFNEDEFQEDYISLKTFLNSYLKSFFTLSIDALAEYVIDNGAEWSKNLINSYRQWMVAKYYE